MHTKLMAFVFLQISPRSINDRQNVFEHLRLLYKGNKDYSRFTIILRFPGDPGESLSPEPSIPLEDMHAPFHR